MKCQNTLFALLLTITVASGCASTKPAEPVAIPQDPIEQLVWSSQPERPGWTMEEPMATEGVMSFVGLSQRFATEKGSRDDAQRHAMENVVKYMGTLVKDEYTNKATNFGLSRDVIDPTQSAKVFEKQLSVSVAKRVKIAKWYMEKWQTPTGIGYQAFCLAHVPQQAVDESYKATAADMARKAEQRTRNTNDEIAKAQAEKAVAFWKQMEEQGIPQ